MNNKKSNPYSNAPLKSFWRTGVTDMVSQVNFDIYSRKFLIDKQTKIATAGSCFAQHIGHRLRTNGYKVLDYEPAVWSMPHGVRATYGYGIYSGRYGNIYTVRQLLQLVKEAYGLYKPQDFIWKNNNGKYIDSLRPGVEPDGYDSIDEVVFHRRHHLACVRRLFDDMELFIFTLGLTEAWRNKKFGTVYPIVPGAIAGEFDVDIYEFVNFSFDEIKADLLELIDLFKNLSFNKKYLFTVSPVPLTATATDQHVLVATTFSKSVLRAAVGDLYNSHENIDYFPSYEMVVNPWTGGKKYDDNQRSVLSSAVDQVMQVFLYHHNKNKGVEDDVHFNSLAQRVSLHEIEPIDIVCEEMLLDLLRKDAQ